MNSIFSFNIRQSSILNQDVGLLVLRLWLAIVLFTKHGAEKVFTFEAMQQKFPDPIGIGPTAGLVFALFADGICSLLIGLGLLTRFAALIIVLNLFCVFVMLHGFSFHEEHAEVVFLYLGAYLFILVSGPGKYSIDKILAA